VTIKAVANGQYVSARIDYGMLRARAWAVEPWEKFWLRVWAI
jgi:hypothetical protein